MSDLTITYNGNRVPPSGTGPIPYVSMAEEVISYGDRWGLANKITLAGQITGNDFNALYTAQTGLTNVFASSYKTLKVFEAADDSLSFNEIYAFSGCQIQDISFDRNGYNKVVGYSVQLLSYPSGLTGYFSGTYGILEPRDEIKITEGVDGFNTITHSVSAKGFVISTVDSAITNVQNYVATRTGAARVLSCPPISGIENPDGFSPVLINLTENLDRLSLLYSVEETYRFKSATGDTESAARYNFNNYYLTSYTTNVSSGAGEDFVTANIQGEIRAGVTGATGAALISGLTYQLSGLNPYAVISGKYGSPNGFSFCKDPIELSLNEDLKSRKISFNISYDNLEFYGSANDKYAYNGCYFDPVISYSIDNLSNIVSVDVKGEIKCRGTQTNRYTNSLVYLGELMKTGTSAVAPRIYDFANDFYTVFFNNTVFALNGLPNNVVVDANPFLGTVSVSCTFDNKDRFQSLGTSDFSLDYLPYNTVYSYASSCNDSIRHLAVDVNIQKREKASIDITLNSPTDSEYALLTKKDTIISNFQTYFVKPLLQNQVTLDTLQEETSSFVISNSPNNGTSLTSDKNTSTVEANKTYSFELSPTLKSNRRIIKSTGSTGNI